MLTQTVPEPLASAFSVHCSHFAFSEPFVPSPGWKLGSSFRTGVLEREGVFTCGRS